MIVDPYPTPRDFGAVPAGPCTSSEALREGAAALGVSFDLDADGVLVNGQRFATLTDADAYLDDHAKRLGVQIARRARDEYLEHLGTEQRRKVWQIEREQPKPKPFGFELEDL